MPHHIHGPWMGHAELLGVDAAFSSCSPVICLEPQPHQSQGKPRTKTGDGATQVARSWGLKNHSEAWSLFVRQTCFIHEYS